MNKCKTIIDLFVEDGYEVKYLSSTYGGNYTSICPYCKDGVDRMQLWPNLKLKYGGRFWCRVCQKKGNAIDYLMQIRKMSHQAACAMYSNSNYISDLTPTTFENSNVPDVENLDLWQKEANEFVEQSRHRLWNNAPLSAIIFQGLHKRGLTDETITKFSLGCNSKHLWVKRTDWGLSKILNDYGEQKKLWTPQGLVIPLIVDGTVKRLRLRLSASVAKQESKYLNGKKYFLISGSSTVPMVLGDSNIFIIVESELDAMLLHQEAGDLLTIIALGSVQIKPDNVLKDKLRQARLILISLDSDDAGIIASWKKWLKQYPNAKRWPVVLGKDPSDAYKNGLNIRQWVIDGINYYSPILDETVSIAKDTSVEKEVDTTDYIIIKTEVQLLSAIVKLQGSKIIGIGIETALNTSDNYDDLTMEVKERIIFDPYHGVISLIQISSPITAPLIIDCLKIKDLSALQDILSDETIVKIFHNAKFSVKFLSHYGLDVKNLFCTMLAAQLINCGVDNSDDYFIIERVVERFLRKTIDKNECHLDWSIRPLTTVQLYHALRDVKVLIDLFKEMNDILSSKGLEEIAKLEFQCIKAVAQMELTGIKIDIDKLKSIDDDLQKAEDYQKENLVSYLGNINFNSAKQVLPAIKKSIGVVFDSMSEKTLKSKANEFPLIGNLIEYHKIHKQRSTYTKSLFNAINKKTNRIHSTFHQIGTVTGRFSASAPNLQSIPKDIKYRQCFVAKEGYQLICADYSQIELRVAADIANDQTMINAFIEGQDLHKLTASKISGRPIDGISNNDEDRKAAKIINFGILYGMTPIGLKDAINNSYNSVIYEEKAAEYISTFLKQYHGIAEYVKKSEKSAGKNNVTTRTQSGRTRYWKTNAHRTELLNSPIQGTAADIQKKAMVLIYDALLGRDTKIISTIHDEIIIEAPNNLALKIADIVTEKMIEAGEFFLKKVPVEVNVTIGDYWGDNSWSEKTIEQSLNLVDVES
ncbi:MAG: hypothetical protein HQK91_08560 [Nitrospirae bacterium]|nr:hypothetical protein [Nitrospirota bacterium]MBF0541484.1 hypothetical protein [Nitrospirota bacterium]